MTITRREFTQGLVGASAVTLLQGVDANAKTPLRMKAIPRTGERIPVVGIGTNRYGVGNDDELRAPLKAALKAFHASGGRVIDTAPGYRTSEIVLGEITSELGIVDDLFMATKVDVEGKSAAADRMQRSFERLDRPVMDLMQVHNFTGWQEALAVMSDWRDEGKIRYIGVTTSRERQYDVMETVMKSHELDFIQINYSLVNQRTAADRLLPLAADRGIAVLINRPFGGGRVFNTLAKATMPEWAGNFGASSWGQFLLKYVLSHPAVTCAIPGMTKERHVLDNLGAALGRLPSTKERRQMETFFDGIQ